MGSISSSSKKSNLEMEKEGKEEIEGRERYETGPRLSELPKECISKILSFTTAVDACKSCVLSRVFRSAADSDITWEKFLPPDYEEMIAASPTPIAHTSKKELYFRLSDHPILLNGGTRSFNLERWSGKRCYMLGAKELNIAWGDSPSHWSWNSIPDSRFAEVALLRNVWHLNITGRIETSILSPATNYSAYLVYKVAEDSYRFDNVPVKIWVWPVDELGHNKSAYEPEPNGYVVFLVQHRQGRGHHGCVRGRLPRQRKDGWMEAEMGEFYNDGKGNNGNYIEMRCRGNGSGSAVILLGIELRPKGRQS